jgi:hypothetical protein
MTHHIIRILGHNFRLSSGCDPDSIGQCKTSGGWIRLETGEQSPDQGAETLLHEIIHILSDELKIKIVHDDVQRLAAGLYQIMVDNPDIIRDILARRAIQVPDRKEKP